MKYLGDLNNFMSRSNGYIPDASGGYIKKKDWLKYKRIERKYNRIVNANFEDIADIRDPYRNVTIRKAESIYLPENMRAAGEIKHRPLNKFNRDPKNIKSADALMKLQAQVEGRLNKNYLPKAIAAGRSQTNAMLDNAGLSELKGAVAALSNGQFNVLFNYWGFAGRLSQIGGTNGKRGPNIDSKNRLDPDEYDSIKADVEEFISEAKKLQVDERPFNNPKNKKK
jgi:hypothetical protein